MSMTIYTMNIGLRWKCRTEGGDSITVLKPGDEMASNVRTLCFDKAGKHLLCTTDAKQAIVWSTEDWSIHHTL